MTDMEDVNQSLEHHGVKGMKWGVRKDRTSKNVSKAYNESVKQDARKAFRNNIQFNKDGSIKSGWHNPKQREIIRNIKSKASSYTQDVGKRTRKNRNRAIAATTAVAALHYSNLLKPGLVSDLLNKAGDYSSSAIKNHQATQAGKRFSDSMGIIVTGKQIGRAHV